MESLEELGLYALLGALQGVTEFLPVSSSGHIAIGTMLFGMEDDSGTAMSVLLHFGTLIATVAVFRKDLWQLTRSVVRGLRTPRSWFGSPEGRITSGVIVGSIPTAIIGLALEPTVASYDSVPWFVGICFLVSAVALLVTRRGGGDRDYLPLWGAFVVGVVQGIAVLPGISRSGSTIAVAMLLAMSGPAAFRFSFLLSLPAIFGATLLKLTDPSDLANLGVGAFLGAAIATIVGYFSLKWLRQLVTQGRFWAFALYLVPLGATLIVYGIVR